MSRKGIGGHQSAAMRTDTWITPPEVINSLGPFDLDPCAAVGQPWPTAARMLTVHDDGLKTEWPSSARVWLNPPYGREIDRWMGKMSGHGNGVALIFARTETEMFFRYVWDRASSIFFFEGRLYFYTIDGKRARANAGAPSCLISYGDSNSQSISDSGLKGIHLPVNTVPVIVVGISPTWKAVITIAVNRNGGEADVQAVYDLVETIAPDKCQQNPHYKEQIRKQLQYHFTRIARGRYTTSKTND